MKTSKSAFDFLMRNVKAKQQQQQQVSSLSIENRVSVCEISSDSSEDVIVIEEKKTKPTIQETLDVPVIHATCHVRQFDDSDRSLLESFKLNENIKLKNIQQTYVPLNVNEIKLGTFTTINQESSYDDYEVKHIFECDKITDFSADYLNACFEKTTAPSIWIDLYHKISKRTDPRKEAAKSEAVLVDTSQNLQNVNEARRSKRRKTETNENSLQKTSLLTSEDTSLQKTEESNILWTEKYQFTDESEIICNKSQLERLKHWLEQFKKTKTKPVNSTKATSGSNSSDEDTYTSNTDGQFDDDDSDFNYDSDCSVSTTSSSTSCTSKRFKFHNNAILLNGPYGSGKTSAVYCVAKQLDFKLFECNTSSLRCKSQIIQELIGVLSSHHVGANQKLSRRLMNEQEKMNNQESKKQQKKTLQTMKKGTSDGKTIDSFFKQKQVLNNSTNEQNTGSRKRRKSNQTVLSQLPMVETTAPVEAATTELKVLKDSLILFDDIDVVLKEDQGFWSVISFFIKNSKKPIILTSNDEHILKKIDLNIEQIKFFKPSREACVNYLKTILLCESKRCINDEFYLNRLLAYNKCDLRHSLLQLQLNTSLVHSRTRSYNSNDNPENRKTRYVENLKRKLRFVENYQVIDYLSRNLKKLMTKRHAVVSHDPLKFDCFIHKEGLIDSLGSNMSPENDDVDDEKRTSSLVNLNRQYFLNQVIGYILNDDLNINNENIDYLANLAVYEPVLNRVLYKFAFTHFKFTSNKALYMDYAPYLKLICKIEQVKQESNSKRRFLHYLNTTSNIGLNKDDYAVLAKDTKFAALVIEQQEPETVVYKQESTLNNDLYDAS